MDRSIERYETELSDAEPYMPSGHGDSAECHAEPPICGCPETRTFIVKVTETKVTRYRLTYAEARNAFPHVEWDNPDRSHAGDMEDETMGCDSLPPVILTMDVDDTDEDTEYRIFEE